MKRAMRILSLMLVFVFAFPMTAEYPQVFESMALFAEESSSQTETADESIPESADENLPDAVNQEYVPAFTLPSDLKAVTLIPETDFGKIKTAEDGTKTYPTEEQTRNEIDAVIADMQKYGMNALIIKTNSKDKPYYDIDINDTVSKTPVEIAVDQAKNSGMPVYLTFDINFVLNQFTDTSLQDRIDYLALQAHIFTFKYNVDGIILEGYYSSKNHTSFDDYMQNGSGIGFENWLLDNGSYVFSLVSDAVRRTNNTIPVGISLKDAWANYSSNNESGSKTSADFQALTDGYADTVAYIKNGYADFILLDAQGSLNDEKLPFNEIATWWGTVASEKNIPLYIQHYNEKICTDEPGWKSPDQIVQQLLTAEKIKGYKGSAFHSYQTLVSDPEESTTALMKYYEKTLNLDTIDNELNIISPTKTTFTTEEPTIAFAGSFDPNFTVYFNGEKIELNANGNFYYEEDLEIGKNIFTIKNKGKTTTFTITRKVTVLKEIQPTNNIEVEGRDAITISAIAYRGSYVTAEINGKTITLSESDSVPEGYENSNYVKYTGMYTAPKGIINKPQNLGRIVVNGTFKGKDGTPFNMSLQGGNVTVAALPEVPNNADGQIMVLKHDNTKVFPYNGTSVYVEPNLARLPSGTIDYVVKKKTLEGIDFYLTNSGKRIKCEDVTIRENEPLGANHIEAVEAYLDGDDTVIKLKSTIKMPFSMKYNGVNFTSSDNGPFAVADFNASSLTFTFDYSTTAGGELSFPGGSIISSASWGQTIVNDVNKYQLTLNLARPGIYMGMIATYDSEGNLILRFNGQRNSLSGTVVVIDPGHGMKENGKIDAGGVGHITDQYVGLQVSKQLETKLRAQGAVVYRFPTESQYIDTYQRAEYARAYNPDLYISIHGNKAPTAPSAHGVEAFYFTPYSQPYAKAVSAAVADYYKNVAYKDDRNHNRGAKFGSYAVTTDQSYAAILLEVGFVGNKQEAEIMGNETHQAGIADAIIKGMKNYLSR